MKRYECIYILRPELTPEEIDDLAARFRTIVEDGGGKVVDEDRWGLKTLAYPVKKNTKGFYVLLDYAAEPKASAELERNFKMLDNVIRFLTVLQEEALTPERLEELLTSTREKPKRHAENEGEEEADRFAPGDGEESEEMESDESE